MGLGSESWLHNEVNSSSSCANESNFKERLNLNFQVFHSLTIFIFILGFSWFWGNCFNDSRQGGFVLPQCNGRNPYLVINIQLGLLHQNWARQAPARGAGKQSRLAQVCAVNTAWELPGRETGKGKLLREDSLQSWWRHLGDPACSAQIPLGRGWSDTQAHLQQHTPAKASTFSRSMCY